jgi:hypothetical protein
LFLSLFEIVTPLPDCFNDVVVLMSLPLLFSYFFSLFSNSKESQCRSTT